MMCDRGTAEVETNDAVNNVLCVWHQRIRDEKVPVPTSTSK